MASDTESNDSGFQSSRSNASQGGGYPKEILLVQNGRLICSVCDLVLRDPVKCPSCKVRSCFSCQRECRKCKDNGYHSKMVHDEEKRLELDKTTVQCIACHQEMRYEEHIRHNPNCKKFLPVPAPFYQE